MKNIEKDLLLIVILQESSLQSIKRVQSNIISNFEHPL